VRSRRLPSQSRCEQRLPFALSFGRLSIAHREPCDCQMRCWAEQPSDCLRSAREQLCWTCSPSQCARPVHPEAAVLAYSGLSVADQYERRSAGRRAAVASPRASVACIRLHSSALSTPVHCPLQCIATGGPRRGGVRPRAWHPNRQQAEGTAGYCAILWMPAAMALRDQRLSTPLHCSRRHVVCSAWCMVHGACCMLCCRF